MQRERSNAPRRQKVASHPVYFRLDARGRRSYEHDYYDSDGRRRWKSGFGTIREAVASREGLHVRIRRGERVVPSRATVAELVSEWLELPHDLRPRTFEKYEGALRVHVVPRIGRIRVTDLDRDDIASLVAAMKQANKANWTIRGTWTPLKLVLDYAVERGVIPFNPMSLVSRRERPKGGRREYRVLSSDEIGALIAAADAPYRVILATAVFAGPRINELLALVWDEVDFDAGFLNVRYQLERATRQRVALKTQGSRRAIVLMPTLAKLLREHRLASPHSQSGDYVFTSYTGTPLSDRNVSQRGFAPAVARAGLNGPTKLPLTFHDLRRTFASLLIAGGEDVVQVSRQLGHSSPKVTLDIYAHLFDAARHSTEMRQRLESSFGTLLTRAAGEGRAEAVADLTALTAEVNLPI
jgi:integrase